MHEMSLVQGLLDQLRELAREHRTSRVTRVTMVIGPLSGVVIDSFRFGFDILSRDDELTSGAELDIVVPEVCYRCSGCGTEQTTGGHRPDRCAACGDTLLVADGGDELILHQVEME